MYHWEQHPMIDLSFPSRKVVNVIMLKISHVSLYINVNFCEYILTIQTFLLLFSFCHILTFKIYTFVSIYLLSKPFSFLSHIDIENHLNSLFKQACYLDVELSMFTIVKNFHLKQMMKSHFINQDSNPGSLALWLVSGELL